MKRTLAIDLEMFSVSMTPQKTMPDLFFGEISEQFYAAFKFKFGYIFDSAVYVYITPPANSRIKSIGPPRKSLFGKFYSPIFIVTHFSR